METTRLKIHVAEGSVIAGLFSAQGLPWLLRLRWLAVAGQLTTCLVVDRVFGFVLPWGVLAGFLLVTAATNLAAHRIPRLFPSDPDLVCAGLLVQDTLVLTGMIWWTGGIHNPFTGFYLLHVVIAAAVLPRGWSLGMLTFSSLCLGAQFLSKHALVARRPLPWLPDDLSRVGVLVGLVLAGGSIAFFVGRLRATLERRDAELVRVRAQTERHERFAAVATLAAGVAHELATPLSTIAVVSSDFERLAGGHCANLECMADARLIRSEVERCRKILENLGNRATSGIGDPPVVVELSDIPQRLRPYLKPDFWERIEFSGFADAGQLVVPEPPLLQSLAALVKNACEASGPSERIGMAVRVGVDDTCFEIEDTGFGMAPEVVARVGEPFFTTKGPGRGMGLGLFLVRTFVERVQGALEIDSRPGEGTLSRIRIPREKVAA